MIDEQKCSNFDFKDVLKHLSKRPQIEKMLVKTFCIVAIILSVGAAAGVAIGISTSLKPLIDKILPQSLLSSHADTN